MNQINAAVGTERRWVSVATIDQLPPGSLIGVQADDLDLLLCNLDGTIHCIDKPTTKERLENIGSLVAGSTPAETARFLQVERNTWGPVIRDAGIKIDG